MSCHALMRPVKMEPRLADSLPISRSEKFIRKKLITKAAKQNDQLLNY